MDGKAGNKYLDYAFCLIVGGIYTYAITLTVLSATYIRIEPLRLFITGVIAIIFFMIVLFNKWTRLISLGLVLLAAVWVLFTFNDFEMQYPHWYEVFLMVSGRIPYRAYLGLTVIWVLCFLIGFVVVIFMLHQFNFFILFLSGAAVFIFTWIPGFARNETGFIIFLFTFCLILIKKINNSSAPALAAVPICVAVIFFTNAQMPVESSLYTQRFIQTSGRGRNRMNDLMYELLNPVHFSFQSTGFSGAGGRLGGPVTPNNRVVMYVQAPGRTYLSGVTSDTYTGYNWLPTLEHGAVNHHGLTPGQFEMLETAAALIRNATFAHGLLSTPIFEMGLSEEEMPRVSANDFSVMGAVNVVWREPYYWHTYMPMGTVTVTQSANRTGTIFRPARANGLWFDEASFDYRPDVELSPLGDMQVPVFMESDTQYLFEFLNTETQLSFIEYILSETNQGVYITNSDGPPMFNGASEIPLMPALLQARYIRGVPLPPSDLSAAEFAHLLEFYTRPENLNRENLYYISDTAEFNNLLNAYASDVLSPYAREVREHFLDVPEITPIRVYALTEEIIDGLDNDYARVTAIQEYLLRFPYTLEPAPVPDGSCFVDFFLFEGQEGYCTYFASAMAVMARIAGVPSRYVEGFVLPPSSDPNEPVTVTNRMAHAWVEVYLEGYGWHIIEATPAYAHLSNPVLPPEITSGDWSDPVFLERMENYIRQYERPDFDMEEFIANNPAATQRATPTPAPVTITAPAGGKDTFELTAYIRKFIYAAVVILIAGIIYAVSVLRLKYDEWRADKCPPKERVKIYFRGLLDIITYYTKPLYPDETPKAYGLRMGKRFAFRSDSVFFRDLIALYYKAEYSPHEITGYDATLMKEAYHDMVNLLFFTRYRPVYIYLRYIKRLGKLSNH